MNIEDFCEIKPIDLIKKRLEYEKKLVEDLNLSRRRFYARPTSKNLTMLKNCKIKRKKLTKLL